MTAAGSASPRVPRRYAGNQVIPDSVLGMSFFVACEIMFFAALVAAMFVVRGSASGWPPLDQPRLPIVTTAGNSLVLLASGVMLWLSARSLRASASPSATGRYLQWAVWLGALFVGVQGMEWARLVHYGLTLQSSSYGSFFYLIIGAHALHAIAAIALLVHVWLRFARGTLPASRFWAAQVFWYFVVGLWPVLYIVVYLL